MIELSARDVKAQRRRSELQDALGDQLGTLLDDPTVRELDINADGSVWVDIVDRDGGRRESVPGLTLNADDAQQLAVAIAINLLREELNEEHDDVVGKLGLTGNTFARVSLHAPPATEQHTVCIRKQEAQARHPRMWVEKGQLDPEHYEAIAQAQNERLNTVTAGAMFAGKTHFQNGLLMIVADIDPLRRYGYVDPIGETVCSLKNHYSLRTSRVKTEQDRIRELMTRNLDSVTLAETKSAAAFDLIDAWNTHHGGHTTTHGTDAKAALRRLETCYMMAGQGPAPKDYIASVVHFLVVIQYQRDIGRRITEVARVLGVENDDYQLEYIGRRYRLDVAKGAFTENA